MESMQNEAIRRVREMQSGFSAQGQAVNTQRQSRASQSSQPLEHNNHKAISEEKPKPAETLEDSDLKCPTAKDFSQLNSPFLFKDKEKLLILLLIMLLSSEKENTELVLALLYIII